jgi:hypothetical protein
MAGKGNGKRSPSRERALDKPREMLTPAKAMAKRGEIKLLKLKRVAAGDGCQEGVEGPAGNRRPLSFSLGVEVPVQHPPDHRGVVHHVSIRPCVRDDPGESEVGDVL